MSHSQVDAGFPAARVSQPGATWVLDPSQPGIALQPPAPPVRDPRWSALSHRLAGPGGYYNIGNAIGLVGGIALSVAAAGGDAGPSLRTVAHAAFDYLAGSTSALSVSVAMLIFFWSGEAYHRAWAGGFPPDARSNRRGDLLSGYGAIALALGLFLLGQPLLAATAGLLHAFGKFGSARQHPAATGRKRRWPDPYRTAVLLSRGPAIVLVVIALAEAFSATRWPGAAGGRRAGLAARCATFCVAIGRSAPVPGIARSACHCPATAEFLPGISRYRLNLVARSFTGAPFGLTGRSDAWRD